MNYVAKVKTHNILKNLPDEIVSEKWRNVFFDIDGKSYIDSIIFPSEQEAFNRANPIVTPDYPNQIFWIEADDHSWSIHITKFAYFFPMPVKE